MIEARRTRTTQGEVGRLFVAVPLPAAVRDLATQVQQTLAGEHWPVRWVEPELMHVTLKFLGDTPLDLVPAIVESLNTVAANTQQFPVRAGGAGAFPHAGKPRVFWLGLKGDTRMLGTLAAAIDRELVPVGIPADERPFRPHITLGRLKRHAEPLSGAGKMLDGLPEQSALLPVDRIELIRSVLGPGGPTYTVLATLPLGVPSTALPVDPVEIVEHG